MPNGCRSRRVVRQTVPNQTDHSSQGEYSECARQVAQPGDLARIRIKAGEDSKGRQIRYVWVGSMLVNCEMTRKGVAKYDNSLGEAYRHELSFRDIDLSKSEIVMSPAPRTEMSSNHNGAPNP